MTDEENEQEQEPKLTRRERRAQAKGDTGSNEVRDRNQRLRAEAAASRKRQRAEERAAAMGEGLGATERVDDALARSADAAGRFVKKNFAWMQWLIVIGAGAGIATLVLRYRNTSQSEKHGHVLASVLSAEYGKVASADPAEPRDPRLVDTRVEFSSAEERAKETEKAWRDLRNQEPEVLAVARLGAANANYDLRKYNEARKGYEAVLKDAHSSSFPQLRARAMEGIGFTYESESKLDEALAAFKKMSNLDDVSQKRLGRFHEARILHQQGKDEDAKKILAELNTALSKDVGPEGPTDYLGAAVRDLLRVVDPQFAISEREELEKKQAEEQARRLQEMIEEMQKKNGKFSIPGMPGSSAPSPLPPTGAAEGTPETTQPPTSSPAPTAPALAPAPAPTKTAPVPSAPSSAPAPPATGE